MFSSAIEFENMKGYRSTSSRFEQPTWNCNCILWKESTLVENVGLVVGSSYMFHTIVLPVIVRHLIFRLSADYFPGMRGIHLYRRRPTLACVLFISITIDISIGVNLAKILGGQSPCLMASVSEPENFFGGYRC